MKNFKITFNLKDLEYKDKNNPGKSEEEIAKLGIFEDDLSTNNPRGKINMNIYVPIPFVDVNNIVNQVHSIYNEALKLTGFQLGQIVISFDKKQNPIDKVQPYRWSDKLIYRMEELDELVKNYNGKLRFSEFKEYRDNSSLWTINQVKTANLAIDYLANVIKNNKLSPYEAVVFLACWSAENLIYDDTLLVPKRNLELADSILPVINNGRGLCVGFSEFAKAVFDTVDKFPNAGILRTSKIGVSIDIIKTNGKPNHCQNLIEIFDPKYGLDGKYIYDLTRAIDTSSFRTDHKTEPSKYGMKVDNDRFLSSKQDIFEVLPNYRFFYLFDEFDGHEELRVEDDNPLAYFKTLKENTENFTNSLGATTTRKMFDGVKPNCEKLARKHPLTVILKNCDNEMNL